MIRGNRDELQSCPVLLLSHKSLAASHWRRHSLFLEKSFQKTESLAQEWESCGRHPSLMMDSQLLGVCGPNWRLYLGAFYYLYRKVRSLYLPKTEKATEDGGGCSNLLELQRGAQRRNRFSEDFGDLVDDTVQYSLVSVSNSLDVLQLNLTRVPGDNSG